MKKAPIKPRHFQAPTIIKHMKRAFKLHSDVLEKNSDIPEMYKIPDRNEILIKQDGYFEPHEIRVIATTIDSFDLVCSASENGLILYRL